MCSVSVLCFGAYGYPEEFVSENGFQFTNEDFGHFMQQHGIKHAKMPAHHAAPNGAAERLLQTTKTTLLKQVMHERVTGCKMTFKDRVKDFFFVGVQKYYKLYHGKDPG